MTDGHSGAEGARDERQVGGAEREARGAAGVLTGPSGILPAGALRAWLVVAATTLIVDTVNVFTALNDSVQHGFRLAPWESISWEATSGVSILIACPVACAALMLAPPGRTRWPAFLGVHLAASVFFSALHVLMMNLMRVALYAAMRLHYPFGASGFLYEYRKDLIAYAVIAAIFWLLTGARPRPAPGSAAAPAPPPPSTFDILEGSRVLRVPVAGIAAVKAAGNYVEFLLTDGRRPLMRAALAEVQDALAPAGFVRAHRSWLVNRALVRGLRPARSGDFVVELEGGLEVPLSRRFPQARAELRWNRPEP